MIAIEAKPLQACCTRLICAIVALLLSGCAASRAPILSDLELSATETAGAPTAPPAPPAPTVLRAKRYCRGDFRGGKLIWVEDVALIWQDNASLETGYRVVRNRIPQDVLPANSTKYHLQFRYDQGVVDPPVDTFAVAAIRDVTSSPQTTILVPRCP